jgi:uncharacterized membrane protein YkvA (DUF1232 family)
MQPMEKFKNVLKEIQQRAQQLKADTFALYLAARHPETPWYARLTVAVVVAYAFSPIDLIPDFIPVLGYLDELVLIPLGIALSIRLIPAAVMEECRTHAQERMAGGKPASRIAAAVIIAIWVVIAALGIAWTYKTFAIFRG